jgi:hypothetical protein
MKQVLKYTLEIDEQIISMPKGSVVLSVQNQDDKICMWALCPKVDKLYPKAGTLEDRKFEVYTTGMNIMNTDNKVHLGTVQLRGFVGHVFEDRS